MRVKKLWAGLVIASMLLALIPPPSVAADPTSVAYNRAAPEVAVLNRYSGSSAKFYDTLLADGSKFNAIVLFGKKPSDRIAEKTLYYNGFAGSVLNELSFTGGNLKRNVSGTFHNHLHKHSYGFLGLGSQDVIAASTLGFSVKGDPLYPLLRGHSRPNEANARLGNMQYMTVNTLDYRKYYGNEGQPSGLVPGSQYDMKYGHSMEMRLDFGRNIFFDKDSKQCTCGGHYVTKTVVAFMDERAPKIESVVFKDGSGNVIPRNGVFGPGSTIKVELHYDEFIRFADDSNEHGDLFIRLPVSGKDPSSHPKAYLKKLDTRTLCFEYQVPNNPGEYLTITGVDLSPLMQDGVTLRQVDKGGSFDVEVPTDAGGNSTGFTTTTAYITDLAGNAITESTALYRAYIDTRPVETSEIALYLVPNNQDVKDALGKTDPAANDYLDKSDNHLGVGDSVTLSLNLNKKTSYPVSNPWPFGYSQAKLHTNWAYEDGTTYVVDSHYAYSTEVAPGVEVTNVVSKQIDILPGMYCVDGPEAPLRITEITFSDDKPFEDMAGNTYQATFDLSQVPMGDCYIDTELPEVTTTAGCISENEPPIYTVTPITENARPGTFRFPFRITDASGVEDLKGAFAWQTEGAASPFEYLVSANTSLEGRDGDWLRGYTGVFYEFTQVGEEQYLFIRPVEGEKYDVYDTEMLFIAKDYAGNKHTAEQPAIFKLNAAWDDVPPTISSREVKRSANESGEGWKLDIDILLQDHTALDSTSLRYAWLDYKPTEPVIGETIDESRWVSATIDFSGTPRNGIATATTTVDAGTRFSQHLVAKAKDTSGNESIAYLGKYEYDLTATTYALEYTTGITSRASLKIKDIDKDGSLILMMPAGTDAGPDEYFVTYCHLGVDGYAPLDPEANLAHEPDEVFDEGSIYTGPPGTSGYATSWIHMRVTENSGTYSFETINEQENEAGQFPIDMYLRTIVRDDTFSGELPVTVLAGKVDAFMVDIYYYPITATGVTVEEILLRVSSRDPEAADAFTDMEISTADVIDTEYVSGFWEKHNVGKPILATAEGVTFQVNLGTDVHGWNHEDVDYAQSYVELLHRGATGEEESGKSFKVPLSYSPIQTVVCPQADYPKGYYDVRLVVNCKAGKDYVVPLKDNTQMYIDNTPAVQKFGISALTYAEKIYQYAAPWHDVNGSINYYLDTEVIYLPVNGSVGGSPNPVENIMQVMIDQTGDIPLPATYALRAWNATAGATAEEAVYSITGESDYLRSFMMTVWDNAEDAKSEQGTTTSYTGKQYANIGLIKNRPNTIAVQILNANGQESAVRHYVIYPVAKDVEGTLSFTRGEDGANVVPAGNLIFTPAAGQSMEGTGVYVSIGYYEYSGGTNHLREVIRRQEMLPEPGGTYTYPLLPNKKDSKWYYVYSVYTIDSYGNLTMFDDVSSAVLDQEAPLVTALPGTSAKGLYEAKFKVEDETLYAVSFPEAGNTSWQRLYMPLKINLRFDKAHAEWLGIGEAVSLDLTLNENEEEFVWQATEASPTGIYEVRAERKKDEGLDYWNTPHWLEVTVKGVVGYKDGEAPRSFTLIMDAADAFGNTTLASEDYETGGNVYGSVGFADAEVVKPAAIITGDGAPAYVRTAVDYDYALRINFTSPVLPEVSWICARPEYAMVQTDAFPITDDGAWIISFADIFGNRHQQELQLENVFNEFGLTLGINPLELTKEVVYLLVRTVEKDAEGALLAFRKTQGGSMDTVTDVDGYRNTPRQEKQLKIDSNQTLVIMHYPKVYSSEDLFQNGYYAHGDRLEININNICQGAPEAEPHFYFEANGTEYTLDNVPRNEETQGDVRVWYSTSRNVIPIGDTGSSYTFKRGGETSHTFSYRDDFDETGELVVDLEALGITLGEPPDPSVDTTPPLVSVALNAKRFGIYKEMESFGSYSERDQIRDSFDAVKYVQGYLLVVNVDEQSGYKIVVKKDVPRELTYATATGDEIPGVSLVGNTIAITEAADFTIAVVDNAAEETRAAVDNFTCISLEAEDMEDWFDNTSPTAETKDKWVTLYEKNVYIKLTDEDDKGKDTTLLAPVTLDSPKLGQATAEDDAIYKDWYKRLFTRNGSEYLVFYDMAGNMGTKGIGVANIDETKPVLTTTWSPYYVDPNDPMNLANPPTGPLNTNVSATVTSSTAIKEVKAEYFNIEDIPVQDIGNKITYRQTANQVFVTFTESGYKVALTVTAPNGKTATEALILGTEVIDKIKPTIAGDVTRLIRPGFSVPYGAKLTFTPSEPVYCINAGPQGALDTNQSRPLYDDVNRPLVVTVYSQETKTYKFVDRAGNPGEAKITTGEIDSTPPKLTVELIEANANHVMVEIKSSEKATAKWGVNNSVTLTANTPSPLTFTENGVHLITAYDEAGNSDMVSVVVGNIDNGAPMISFDKLTVSIIQDSVMSMLQGLLDGGVNVWDDVDDSADLQLTYVADAVKLDTPGIYPVTYMVTDKAGNVGEGIRYVRVIDKNLPLITIDGDKLAEPEGTTILSLGAHRLAVTGLKEVAPGMMEPYTLKIRRGIITEGQMKYYSSTVSVAENGYFTIDQVGFYTMHIVTQSRQSYRTLLYVER